MPKRHRAQTYKWPGRKLKLATPPHDAGAIRKSGIKSGQLTQAGIAEKPDRGKPMYCPDLMDQQIGGLAPLN